MIGIGIDTGGTYTDAVVFNTETDEVLAKTKSLTTKEDLSIGIGNALDNLPAEKLALTESVSLSTTLATNACVEGKGGRAKLIIVGTTTEILHRINAEKKYGIPYADTLAVDYKGTYDGSEVVIPDWEAIWEANRSFFDDAESYGLAGVYALNNGAAVEKSGYEFLKAHYPEKPVVLATTVATATNVMERGATALLNARLIPVIRDFMEAVGKALRDRGLDLPVMIVRSDGSLMSEELARVRPVETILSGPAASVSGARSLSTSSESLIIDIGGTTSDISVIHDDKPVMTDGIAIGGWKTQIAGVFIDTIGLGGDTAVRFNKNTGALELSNRRVQPLCIAASRWPEIKAGLRHYLVSAHPNLNANYEFFYKMREPRSRDHFNEHERNLLELLDEGPVGLFDNRIDLYGLDTTRLEAEGIVMRCGMTSTDAMHIKGDFTTFDAEASELGARCILKTLQHDVNATKEWLVNWVADLIYELAERRLYNQVVRVLMQDRYPKLMLSGLGDQLQLLIDDAWKRHLAGTPARPFDVDLSTDAALIGIGAPTHILLPEVAKALKTECIIPPHHEVANAIGAIHAEIAVHDKAWISPNRGPDGVINSFQVHSSEMNEEFELFEDAYAAAKEEAARVACAEARRRGAIGELFCEVEEDEAKAVGGDGLVVTLNWTFNSHVRTVERGKPQA